MPKILASMYNFDEKNQLTVHSNLNLIKNLSGNFQGLLKALFKILL